MVYRGKPSANCGRCRARRLKCDQATPSCSQCLRAHEKCPGYRDLTALAFRNESADVVRKAQQHSEARKAVSGRTDSPASRDLSGRQFKATSRSSAEHLQVRQQPSTPMHEQATCFVFRNYVCQWLRPYANCLTTPQSTEDNTAVISAMTALGLAALANIKMSPTIMMAAREEYTAALACANRNLRDVVLSKQDSTLAAVMFLGLFERWRKHVEGAAKLIEWRGEEQLKSPHSQHLFRQMRAQIIINNVFGESYTSPTITRLSQKAFDLEESDLLCTDALGNISVRLSKFCADMKHGVLADSASIVNAALALDADLVAWAINIHPSWAYTTVTMPGSNPTRNGKSSGRRHKSTTTEGVYGDHYHVYRDLYASNIWNNYRAARFVVQEAILICLDKRQQFETLGVESSRLVSHSEAILRELSEEICASAPFHFGATGDPDNNTSLTSGSPGPYELQDSTAAVAGYVLIWPLFLAADSRVSSPSLKNWVIMCLGKIGHGMGISQALAMAALLRKGMGSRSWNDGDEDDEDEDVDVDVNLENASAMNAAMVPVTV